MIFGNTIKNGYQNWLNVIKNYVLYKYYKQHIIVNQIGIVNQKIRSLQANFHANQQWKGEQQKKYYGELLQKLWTLNNGGQKFIQQNFDNQQMLREVYQMYNIDTSYDRFKQWIDYGKQFTFQ